MARLSLEVALSQRELLYPRSPPPPWWSQWLHRQSVPAWCQDTKLSPSALICDSSEEPPSPREPSRISWGHRCNCTVGHLCQPSPTLLTSLQVYSLNTFFSMPSANNSLPQGIFTASILRQLPPKNFLLSYETGTVMSALTVLYTFTSHKETVRRVLLLSSSYLRWEKKLRESNYLAWINKW